MHNLIKHIAKYLINSLIIFSFALFASNALSEQSIEEIIKGRKALFSKNYNTAKRVQSYSAKGDFDQAKKLMIEMSVNYKSLLNMFPNNTQTGFKTGSLPAIWQNKKTFDTLMLKSSNDMIELASLIETTDNIKGTIGKLMWGNCKACHSNYREEH